MSHYYVIYWYQRNASLLCQYILVPKKCLIIMSIYTGTKEMPHYYVIYWYQRNASLLCHILVPKKCLIIMSIYTDTKFYQRNASLLVVISYTGTGTKF
jgi:ribosomal protein S19E (S16A)